MNALDSAALPLDSAVIPEYEEPEPGVQDSVGDLLAATTFVKAPSPHSASFKLPADAKARSCTSFMKTGTCQNVKAGRSCPYSHNQSDNKFDASSDIKTLTARYYPAIAETISKMLDPPRPVTAILKRGSGISDGHDDSQSRARASSFNELLMNDDEDIA